VKILKIKGKNENIVLQEIQKEYGDTAIIINRGTEKRKGIGGLLKKPLYSITIAIEDTTKGTPLSLENQKKEEVKDINKQEENSVTNDPNYLATQQLLIHLKEQLEEIKKDIKPSNVPNGQVQEESFCLYKQMEKALQDEGIDKEPLAFILEPAKQIEDITEMAKIIYERLGKILNNKNRNENISNTIFFIGSTGVGKTTTIAKLTANSVLKEQRKIALFTADTYRIAAIEQLKTYADILNVPIEIVYSERDLKDHLVKWKDCDAFFVDTAGRSHKNVEQMEELKGLLDVISDKKVYVVLTMNTSPRDLKQMLSIYKEMTEDFELIITKMDETDEIGNLINIAYFSNANIAYITNGQNVPDDFICFDQEEFIKKLLGRISYE
jgi:flagellar biosynthesis protein FlhF